MIDNIQPAQKSRSKTKTTKKDDDYHEPAFVTPAEVAATDQEATVSLPQSLVAEAAVARPKKIKHLFKSWSYRQWGIAVAALLITSSGGASWYYTKNRIPADDNWRPSVGTYQKPAPTTVPSRLTGEQVTPDLNQLPVTGVMIENSPDARPQSGLKEAGVVFEAIAEGGITRYLALYMEAQPAVIGPVRSVRPYFLDFLRPFDAPIAHAGGSGEALAQISSEGIKDLDQFANGGAYQRRNHRYAPHNLYTSRAALLDLQRSKGFGTSEFAGFVRKAEKKSAAPNATTIDIKPSSALYASAYTYDAESNSYKRSLGNKPHTDEQSGAQLQPKVVIALVVPHSYRGIYSHYAITGSGKAYIFQDGSVTEGTWEKASRTNQFKFGDVNGAPLGLNPGQTWLTLVRDVGMVSFR